MIVWIDCDRIHADGREQRVIRRNAPGCGTAATVGRFPDAAANRTKIRDDTAVDCRSWVDRDGVYPALCLCVVVAARAAGHLQGRRTERSKTAGAKCQRRIE